MWLRNWYTLLNALFLSRTDDAIPGTNPSDTPALSYRGTSGTYYKAIYQDSDTESNSRRSGIVNTITPGKYKLALGTAFNAATAGKVTIIFGTGTTPVTFDDYRIETPIASGLSLANINTSLLSKTAYINNSYAFKTTATVTNTSDSNITINEIALNSDGDAVTMCIYREVLSEPIVLAPNESVVIEFNFAGSNMIPSA